MLPNLDDRRDGHTGITQPKQAPQTTFEDRAVLADPAKLRGP